MFAQLFRRRTSAEPAQLENRVGQFLNQLLPQGEERRSHERIPFCRSTTIYFDDDTTPLPAMIRDVSLQGVGLLHDASVKLCEATIRIPIDYENTLCARIEIVWCRLEMRHYLIVQRTLVIRWSARG